MNTRIAKIFARAIAPKGIDIIATSEFGFDEPFYCDEPQAIIFADFDMEPMPAFKEWFDLNCYGARLYINTWALLHEIGHSYTFQEEDWATSAQREYIEAAMPAAEKEYLELPNEKLANEWVRDWVSVHPFWYWVMGRLIG